MALRDCVRSVSRVCGVTLRFRISVSCFAPVDETGCANPTALAADESVVVDGVGADATGGTKGELDGGWDGWEAWDVDGGVEVSSNGMAYEEAWRAPQIDMRSSVHPKILQARGPSSGV